MVKVHCGCGCALSVPEGNVNQVYACGSCGRALSFVSAESLPNGAGEADFDARLIVVSGPQRVGEQIHLGGVVPIEIGKLAQRHIVLEGELISRMHARLERVDFGPSRWRIVDAKSRNGVAINGHEVTQQELVDGDLIRLGDYELKFFNRAFETARVKSQIKSSSEASAGQPVAKELRAPCPSCQRPLAKGAKICVDCGINIESGRPLLISQGVDENMLQHNAENIIEFVSYALPFTLLPIPIASEAFGTSRPYTIWGIGIMTIIASLVFFIYSRSDDSRPGKELMLWSPYAHVQPRITTKDVDEFMDAIGDNPDFKADLQIRMKKLKGTVPEKDLQRTAIESFIRDEIGSTRGEFHWWQLITHAFLHDTSSIWGFITHLLGNMLFLMVFGTRVNALIGNIATAFLYPILGAAAGWAQMWMGGDNGIAPLLGASGAINGLAGMYLILFPMHRLFCAMWIRIWFFFGFRIWTIFYAMKVFALRGFWVLLIYLGYDLVMNWAQSSEFGGGGVAHWAHIGGFLAGAVVALGLLLSRMFNCRGGDLLSALFGKHAWPLIGKPSRWKPEPTIEELAERAIRLDYQAN